MINFEEIRQKALQLGWDDVGITEPTIPAEDIMAYKEWLAQGHHGKMAYMENQIRCHPDQLLPEAKAAILFISYYKQPRLDFREDAGLIASYARGRDYHGIHRKRLKKFIVWLEELSGQKHIAKGFSDSYPILEKALAVQAGLGWFGKNTLLIHRKFGTFILLSGILTTLDIAGKTILPRVPRCGSCTRCLDACPTQAISPYHLDATRCLSYHLIESKEKIPQEIKKKNPGYVFGCDICQDVCPHNARKPDAESGDFNPENGIGGYLTLELINDIEAKPDALFGTPLQRRKAQGLKENLDGIIKRSEF